MSEPSLPNIRMFRRGKELPPAVTLAEGFALREARAEEDEPIADLLTRAFGDPWTVEKVNEELLRNDEVLKTFVVESKGRLVATASYQLRPLEPFPTGGWLHWVAADPDRRGKGLGYVVSSAVIAASLADGKDVALLETQDHRLPAIRTYLKLGFEPDPWHESHPARWRDIMQNLDAHS